MLYDKIKDYLKSGIYPFHMPGHKRSKAVLDGVLPYEADLTEINGFDNLQNPEGCIKEVEKKAAQTYGVGNAFLLVNGATGGILSTVRSMTNYGDTIIMARNCHKSVYNAVELCGLNAVYALPDVDSEFGIFASISPKQIEKLLYENNNVKLVIITSPTYEGIVSDVKSISEICHKFGAKLFVDEAHGAHFPFSDKFPCEAVKIGADAAVVSLHKTLPSLTQTALLLTNDNSITDILKSNLSVFQTSSPSYILMSSIDRCIDLINSNNILFNEYISNLKIFSEKCKSLSRLKVMCCGNDSLSNHSFYDFDIGKIIVSSAYTNITGKELANILRDKYKIEIEMAYTDYIIAMTSVCDTKDSFILLSEALLEIDKTCIRLEKKRKSLNYLYRLPERKVKSSEKYRFKSRKISVNDSLNMVSLEYVWAYPPGIPLIVPGEIINKNTIMQIKNLTQSGINVYSTYNKLPNEIYAADLIDKI